jgi:hypothetical protein
VVRVSEREGVKLDEAGIRARAEAAWPGPWSERQLYWLLRFAGKNDGAWNDGEGDIPSEDAAAFIAHAREDIPALLDALASERARADKAEQERDGAQITLTNAQETRNTAEARADAYREALEKIKAIPKYLTGPDWSEIEEAQAIASAALARGEKGER